jgi:tetratricopeptide (TPR) repeat protein
MQNRLIRTLFYSLLCWFAVTLTATAQSPLPAARLVVTCHQPDANVFIDHVLIGKAPLRAAVTPGPHNVRVSIDENWMPFEQTVTATAGSEQTVDADLTRTSISLFHEALERWQQGDAAGAAPLFEQAAEAPGKRPAEIPFYQGLVAEKQGDVRAAERDFLNYVSINDRSPAGHYHLAMAREANREDALAATSYKTAILRLVANAERILSGAGDPSAANQNRLQQMASRGDNLAAGLQLGYVLELRGLIDEARDQYRRVFEGFAHRAGYDVNQPAAPALPVTLQVPSPEPTPTEPAAPQVSAPPAAPADALYVTSDTPASVATTWHSFVKLHPTAAGRTLISGTHNHWVTIEAGGLARQDPVLAEEAAKYFSSALHTSVVDVLVTHDGRAWYFYWANGHVQDRYCSNPGHINEVPYTTLRMWSGKPDVLVNVCRGEPFSKRGTGKVTMTDLNAILYFYYPEMRIEKPAAWRSPSTFAKQMSNLLGTGHAPMPVSTYPGTGWSGFHSL